MNNQLIEKIIRSNQQTCPQFIYSNPALDVKVTEKVSKGLVKLFEIIKDDENPTVRRSLLESIRNMCKNQPPGHVDIDENITGLLVDVFQKHISTPSDDIDKQLDAFLIRTSKEVSITHSKTPFKPEVVKALINLNYGKDLSCVLSNSLIHWNSEDIKVRSILDDLWARHKYSSDIPEDLSIKARSEIERLLLENTLPLLEDQQFNNNDIFTSNNDILTLIKLCSVSPNCFQICTSILNSLLILSHFDKNLLQFIHTFVFSVKNEFKDLSFSVLYQTNLTHVATLLDFDVDEIQNDDIKCKYVMTTLNYLNLVNKQSEDDLIMLLSHFKKWFDVYLSKS